MRLGAIIRAEKSDIQIGAWGQGHIPPRQFYLRAKPTTFKLGPLWEWAVIKFTALGQQFRILVLFNGAKEIYRAILAVDIGGEMKALCVHEFHASEPGWHCHAVLDSQSAPTGWARRGMRRHPRGAKIHEPFDVTKGNALRIAQKIYRIEAHGPLL